MSDTGQRKPGYTNPSIRSDGQRHVAHPPAASIAVPVLGPDPDGGRDDGQRRRSYSNDRNDDVRDGQHRVYGMGHPGEATGQTSHPAKGLAYVGNRSGGESVMDVPNAPKGAEVPPGTVIPGGKR